MSKHVPIEHILVIKILEEYGFGSVLKKYLKKASLIDEYKNGKFKKIDGISLNVVRKIAKKCIKKCSSSNMENGNEEYKNENNISDNEENEFENPRKRVKKSNRRVADSTLLDNTYWSNKSNDYATKAALDLECVRGKQFRNEKNKKKKKSWRGNGSISTKVNSIIFDD